MSAPAAVIELVERFARQRDAYRSGDYNEARLRREFLDPFFAELGWDMVNRRGYAEAYKDVIHEDSIRTASGTKAPDYCFRIAATRKFFVEAKKPAVNIKEAISPAYQLRRYAWTAKLPLSILTDFEEFAVYDCRVRPNADDKASTARTKYLTFDEYPSKWDEIANTFSHDAVLKGSFDSYASTGKGKRGTTEVDDAFLEEIERWREVLAKNIAERNGQLTQQDLNFAVQRTIDRIIFLRICEDRGVEDYGRLQKLIDGPGIYSRLVERFRRADERYNSGLFHFSSGTGRAEGHDELTPRLLVDDKPLKDILGGLYYPSSPYEFSVLPADILGNVYERFLGKVIRLTPAHRAKIEERPEVRKAGGVYYTPSYVVDHIVAQTVGRLLIGKTPEDAKKIRILDPACGSGSFLLGAYQFLLDWHLQFYSNADPEKLVRQKQPPIFLARNGAWRLTANTKKQILLNSIFGVDLDAQAIEVTKLSLLLKVLEGETEETVNATLKLFQDRALPDLGQNLLQGNSLIGADYRTFGQLQLPNVGDDDVMEFDWQKAFPRAFKDGGFDVVIGNPPYLSYAGRQSVELPSRVRQYFAEKFESSGWPTAHTFFLERSLKLLSRKYVSFIVPDQVGHLVGYSSIREIANREGGVIDVRYWGEHVFKSVTTPALTFTVDKEQVGGETEVFERTGASSRGQLTGGNPWTFAPSAALIRRLHVNAFSLDKFIGDCGIRTTSAKDQVVELKDAKGKYVPALEGKRVQRYTCEQPEIAVRLDSRKDVYVSAEKRYKAAKWLVRQTAAYPIVGPHEHATHFRNSLLALFEPDNGTEIEYLVALLNSRLMRFIYTETVREARQQAFPQVKVGALRTLPMRRIDPSKREEKAEHDALVRLVGEAVALGRKMMSEQNPLRREALHRKFEMTDAEIDQRVFRLYGLSAEEITLVEQAVEASSPKEGQRPKSWRPPALAIGSLRKTQPERAAQKRGKVAASDE
jgi:Eco57I restriction-modification methylase/restriction endonuclease TaqI-like protein/type I restriction and modification enzyme subunit R-like protein